VYAKDLLILNYTGWATVSALFCALVPLVTLVTKVVRAMTSVALNIIGIDEHLIGDVLTSVTGLMARLLARGPAYLHGFSPDWSRFFVQFVQVG
jgi:hypothetical protein